MINLVFSKLYTLRKTIVVLPKIATYVKNNKQKLIICLLFYYIKININVKIGVDGN